VKNQDKKAQTKNRGKETKQDSSKKRTRYFWYKGKRQKYKGREERKESKEN